MAGRRYSQEEKSRAMGALMASATSTGGKWMPQYRRVSKQTGISDKSLRNWWKARDRGEDAILRRASARARGEIVEAGAKDWLEARVTDLREGVEFILSPTHRELKETFNRDGVSTGFVYPVRPDQLARAYKDCSDILTSIKSLVTDGSGVSRQDRIARVRRAATRLKMGKK